MPLTRAHCPLSDASAQQHLAPRVAHHGSDAGQPEGVVPDPLAQGQDEVGSRHDSTLTTPDAGRPQPC